MIETAKKYIRAGYSVLPVDANNKAPKLKTWKHLQKEKYTEKECEGVFKNSSIALIGGEVSNNLEMIDIDNHLGNARAVFEDLRGIVDTFELPYETTQRGGYHIFYRCSSPIEGNQKLARMLNSRGVPETVVETRGEGGYCLVSPTKGYVMQEGDLCSVPIITKDKRDFIISECKKLNTYSKEESSPKQYNVSAMNRTGERLGDKYNRSLDGIAESKSLLKLQGWKFDSKEQMAKRPNKEGQGWSATFGRVKSTTGGYPLFYVFSSNAHPFEQDRAYSPFTLFTLLAHNGDYSAAAKELSERDRDLKVSLKNKHYNPSIHILESSSLPRAGAGANTQTEAEEANSMVTLETREEEDIPSSNNNPISKTIDYLRMVYDFRLDEIKNEVQCKRKISTEWVICNENDIYIELRQSGIKIKKDDLRSLLGSKFVPTYNAFKDYFKGLPKWDGKNHFIDFAQYIDVDNKEFFTVMLEKQFVRAIKCALEDDFYNRFAFILKSRKQELGKSRLIQYFNPFGKEYFSSEFLTSNKDSIISLSENFIYNLDDLDDVNKQVGGIGKLKALLAKSNINLRLPYGKQKKRMARRCSFFGSTNQEEFLTDSSNTRWLIFNVHYIDWKVFKKVDINKLWSQAYALYQDEFYNWDLTVEEKELREKMNMRHKESSAESEILATRFMPTDNDSDQKMTLGEIGNRISQLSFNRGRSNISLSELQSALITMGYIESINVVNNTYIKWYNIKER